MPRPLFLHQMVFPAAGLRAVAPVGIPARHVIGEQAPAGKRNAHCAMHKAFNCKLPRRARPQLADLRKRHFPRGDNPLCAKCIKSVCSGVVDDPGLRGNMEFHLGRIAPGKLQYPQIRDDKGIHAAFCPSGQKSRKRIDLRIARQRIAGEIDPHAPFMRVFHRTPQLVKGKVCGRRAHPKSAAPEIHGVRAEAHGGFQAFTIPCRGEQFRAPFPFVPFNSHQETPIAATTFLLCFSYVLAR